MFNFVRINAVLVAGIDLTKAPHFKLTRERASLQASKRASRRDNMKTIEFENKKYKLPCDVVYDDCELVEVVNPYSGQKCILPRFARGVYVAIKNAEVDGKHKKMRKLLDWFSKNFTDEYYTLLD